MKTMQLVIAIILAIALITFCIYAYNLVDRTPIIQMISKIKNLEDIYGFAYKESYIVALYKDDTEENILKINNCYLRSLQYDNGKIYLVAGRYHTGTNAKVYCIDLETEYYTLNEVCKTNIYNNSFLDDKNFYALNDCLYFAENKQNKFKIIKYDTIKSEKTILKEIDENESVFTNFEMALDKKDNTIYYFFYRDNYNYKKNIRLQEDAEIYSMNLTNGTDTLLVKGIVQTGGNFDCNMKVVNNYIYYYNDRDKNSGRDVYRYNINTRKSESISSVVKFDYYLDIDTFVPYDGGYIYLKRTQEEKKPAEIILDDKNGKTTIIYKLNSEYGWIPRGINMISERKIQFTAETIVGDDSYIVDLKNNTRTKVDKIYSLVTFI